MTPISYVDKVEAYATKIIAEEFSDKLVFHDIKYVLRVVSSAKTIGDAVGISSEEKEILLIAAWFSQIGFKDLNKIKKTNDPYEFFIECNNCSISTAKEFLIKIGYPAERTEKVIKLLAESGAKSIPQSKLAKILADAITVEWGLKKSKKRIELRYQEFLLLDILTVNKGNFYENILNYLRQHEYYTDYGIKQLAPKKEELIQKIEKQVKDLEKQEKQVLKKELNISEEELKKLKKSLKSVKGRDDRGIQTMFRTTSRNHYTLTQMVDRKANIMISLNAIIMSLIISRIIGTIDTWCIHNAPILILLLSSVVSIILAVAAIMPATSHGEFSEEQIRSREGNLLYYGNYHNMSFRDFNWGFLQMMNDSDYMYTTMIKDLYFMGQKLDRKSTFIRKSLVIFVLGIVLTVAAFVGVSTLPDFHFGGSH